jgi:hypothetical protein
MCIFFFRAGEVPQLHSKRAGVQVKTTEKHSYIDSRHQVSRHVTDGHTHASHTHTQKLRLRAQKLLQDIKRQNSHYTT